MTPSAGTVRGRERADLVKLTVFLVFAALLAAYLVVFTSGARPGRTVDYRAVFGNVSGLRAGDQVRIAGVTVGKVRSVEVRPDATVLVGFDVDDDVVLNDSTSATVRYKNLIGDRILELTRPSAEGTPLPAGAELPRTRTASALDLDTLLNGFKPLFAGLNPAQVNELSTQLVGVLQGQTGAVRTLVRTVGSFTDAIADREELVSGVITNLNTVLGTVDAHKGDLGQLVDGLSELTRGLARQDTQILDAAERIDGFSTRAAALVRRTRGDLTPGLNSLRTTAAGITSNAAVLETVLRRLPDHYRTILNTASYGNFFNFFLCGVRLQLTDGANPVQSPWFVSDLARCHR